VDSEGNAAAVTTTVNVAFQSGVTVTGAGFLLNQEMDDFAVAPGRPNQFGLVQGEVNAVAPNKRMLSAMTPSIIVDPEGQLFMVVGSPGGPTIITSVYHVISNVIDHGMSLADAVSAPRIHHQALPDVIQHETGGLKLSARARLEEMGHAFGQYGWGAFMANVNAVRRTADGWIGVADPRLGGSAQGY
jgi:gamma-glutamyltranspeptidase/glutathione hydrolase